MERERRNSESLRGREKERKKEGEVGIERV